MSRYNPPVLRSGRKLYHYATEQFDILQTKARQSGVMEKDAFAYNNSISFFFEPIPLSVPKLLNHEHKFWKRGTRVYQHVIDLDTLPFDLAWFIAETPDVTEKIYSMNWDDEKQIANNRKVIEDIRNGTWRGKGLREFETKSKPFVSGIKEAFQNLYQLHVDNPDDDLLKKYAACVPHAMLYLGQVEVPVKEVSLITF